MADCSPSFSQQASEVNVQNIKNVLDLGVSRDNQAILDNQSDSRAWSAFKLSVAQDNQTAKYLSTIAQLTATQTGETDNEQSVNPIRTGAGDAIAAVPGVAAGGVATASQAVATSLGNLASALVSVIEATGGIVTAQTLAALLPVVVNAAGGASTPSQTEPKPTATS